jgi:RNA polymerase sigma factor (sigma-70 family)
MESDVTVQRRVRFFQNADEYNKKLSARVYSWTHNVERMQETVQQVLLKYLEEMEAEGWVRPINNELAYLTRMARNLLIDIGRAEGRTDWISFEGEPDDGLMRAVVQLIDSFDVEKQIYLDELFKILPWKTIFGKLSPEKRELVQLYYLEDWSVEEIAEKLNAHPVLIKYWISSLEATIRARVKKLYGKKGLFKSDF